MKHLKLLMAALAMMMGLTMTSCLESDDEYKQTYTAVAKLNGNYGTYQFVTPDGFTITPSLASISSFEGNNGSLLTHVGKVFLVYYTLADGQTIDENTTSVSEVKLEGLMPIDRPVEVVEEEGDMNDSINNTPIITLKYSEELKPAFFDRSTLYLCVNYYMENVTHDMTLMYYPNRMEYTDMPTFYLHHDKNTDNILAPQSTSYYWASAGYFSFFYMTFDISDALYRYNMDNGASGMAQKVRVVAYENGAGIDMETAKTAEYIIEYKPNSSSSTSSKQ